MLEELGNLGDFVGGLAVIATLIYLAVQIRQNNKLQRANSLTITSDANLAFNLMLGGNPAAARVFQVGLENFALLDDGERRQFINLLRASFSANQHQFHLYELGLLEAEVWERARPLVAGTLGRPHIRAWWNHRKQIFSPRYVEEIENAQVAAPTALADEVVEAMLAASPNPRQT